MANNLTTQAAECMICFQYKQIAQPNIYENKNAKCSWDHPFCEGCIVRHIFYKIEEGISDVQCPGIRCTQILDPIACSSIISPTLFRRWSDLLAVSFITRSRYQRFICPYKRCSEIIIDECRSGLPIREKVKCPKCKGKCCLHCGGKWTFFHHLKICKRHGEAEDTLFYDAAMKWKWKRCPKCRYFVELISGCEGVHCRCGTKFCHRCGVKRDQFSRCDCSLLPLSARGP